MVKLEIREAEYKQRVDRVRRVLTKRKLDALYLTNTTSMFYLTGYSFISTERPAALIIPADGKITFMGPLLEKDHVPLETKIIEDVKTYTDYPGKRHPIEYFADFLRNMGLAKKRVGIDNKAGALGAWNYEGLPITKKMPNAKFADMSNLVPSMRIVKSQGEVALMRESAKWAKLACSLLQEHVAEGAWDAEVAFAASREAASKMKKALGPEYAPRRSVYPVSAYFRGQVGEMSAIPHAMASKRTMKRGDVLIGEVGVDVGGYSCELERTFILGKPTRKQRRYFDVMVKAQDAAFRAIKAKVKCSAVDKATMKVFKSAGLDHLVKHHTGHGLGLEGHELPWLDVGNDELLENGMTVSCEPGIYEVGFAGFRHSDTVVVNGETSEIVTSYPRSLEELTVT